MSRIVHLIGIGGTGMSPIAEILLQLKFVVQGSDIAQNCRTLHLQSLGIKVFYSHSADNVSNSDLVIISSAITQSNCELIEAVNLKIPIFSRAQIIAELMRFKQGIIISGSHGKTTTASLIGVLLQNAKTNPTVIVGGKVNQLYSNNRVDIGRVLVAEADESDGSFLLLSPNIVVLTNLDTDHLDYWRGGLSELKEAFIKFLNLLPVFGAVILNWDDFNLRELALRINRQVITYGMHVNCEYRAVKVTSGINLTRFTVERAGIEVGIIETQLQGEFNIKNILGVIAVGFELGISFSIISKTLKEFLGVQRRFCILGTKNSITVVDDYAHHPVEISNILTTARKVFSEYRLVVLFEPHRYTRTRDLISQFLDSFLTVNFLIITNIYAACESMISGVDFKFMITSLIRAGHKNVIHGGCVENSKKILLDLIQPNDIVLVIGAGFIAKTANNVLTSL